MAARIGIEMKAPRDVECRALLVPVASSDIAVWKYRSYKSWRVVENTHALSEMDIASVLRNVLDIMLKHYSETYLVIVSDCERNKTYRAMRQGLTDTAFDNYIVCMARSISVRLAFLLQLEYDTYKAGAYPHPP
jgi:hypothetical protein